MQTSFIPKKTQARKKVKKNYGGLFMGIGAVVFILAILLAGAVFLYNRYLISEIERMSEDLARQKGSLEREVIQELSRLDERIEASKDILDKHVTLSPLFELLERNTLQEVKFESLSFHPEDDGWILEMNGMANSYATIALQSDVFGDDKNMSELIFSNLGVGSDGGVVFDVSAKIDLRLLSYRNSLE